MLPVIIFYILAKDDVGSGAVVNNAMMSKLSK